MKRNETDPRDATARRWLSFAAVLTLSALIGGFIYPYILIVASRPKPQSGGEPGYSFDYGLITLHFLIIGLLFLFPTISLAATRLAHRASPLYSIPWRRTLTVLDVVILAPFGAYIAYILWSFF